MQTALGTYIFQESFLFKSQNTALISILVAFRLNYFRHTLINDATHHFPTTPKRMNVKWQQLERVLPICDMRVNIQIQPIPSNKAHLFTVCKHTHPQNVSILNCVKYNNI